MAAAPLSSETPSGSDTAPADGPDRTTPTFDRSRLEASLAEVLRSTPVPAAPAGPEPAEPPERPFTPVFVADPRPPVAPEPPTIVPGSTLPSLHAVAPTALRLPSPVEAATALVAPLRAVDGVAEPAPRPPVAPVPAGLGFDLTAETSVPGGDEGARVDAPAAERLGPVVADVTAPVPAGSPTGDDFTPRPWRPEDDDILPAQRGRRGLRLRR